MNKLFVQGEQTVCSHLITDPDVPIFYFISSLIELEIFYQLRNDPRNPKFRSDLESDTGKWVKKLDGHMSVTDIHTNFDLYYIEAKYN